ncbi:MAG: hypothetical protein M3O98_04465 [Actinomycetota bacterium]|nr:hypothetical protein [Actinomycetota bacterium]
MRRTLVITIGLPLALLAAGCGRGGSSSPSPSSQTSSSSPPAGVTGGAGTIINPSGSVPPTSSPGITGSVTRGTAGITITGRLNETVTLGELTGAVWAPPPSGIALTWTGAKHQSLSIGGPSFTSQQPTSDARVLSFGVLDSDGRLLQFRSAAGECLVTINPALPADMGGVFTCRNLTSSDGAATVDAQGTFSATG